jgi:hypothetical protein
MSSPIKKLEGKQIKSTNDVIIQNHERCAVQAKILRLFQLNSSKLMQTLCVFITHIYEKRRSVLLFCVLS